MNGACGEGFRFRLLLALVAGWGGTSLHAADMAPVNVTGFNRDLVIENTTDGPPYVGVATRFNPNEVWVFYQSGLPGHAYGFPETGHFESELGDGTEFQLQPYTDNNALVMSDATGMNAGTLTLVTPQTFARIAVIAHSASGGGVPSLTLNFEDGSTYATTYNAPDWFNGSGAALSGFERIDPDNGTTQGAPNNPRLYQTTLDVAGWLGISNRALASLTFHRASGAGSTGVYAVSGEPAPEMPATIFGGPTNVTVAELGGADFTASAAGNPFPSLQWFKNGTAIPGATRLTHTIVSAALEDDGAAFHLVASNRIDGVSHVVSSSVATLNVLADATRPVLLGARSQGLTEVVASFSERLTPVTAMDPDNYSLAGSNGPIAIADAALDASQSNVVLTVAGLVEAAPYTLTVNNLADQSVAGNVITNNSQATFVASVYASVGIGNPTPPGVQVALGGGWDLSGGGMDIGGTNDQFQFSHEQRTGDFDVRIRIDSLTLADAWSEAGLVVREALTPGARSASVMATPSISGCYFQSRGTSNGVTALSGSFPVNYPNTWLRLKRVGNDFTGYAGLDGQNWTALGAASLPLPATVYFGFAVASHDGSRLATAAFRDFSDVTLPGIAGPLTFEPLGQSSRRTSLVISEIMYHPTNSLLEFVEIFNTLGEPHDLGGYRLRGDVDYDFPPGTVLPGGGFLVVARSPVDLQSAYGIEGALGPFTNNLPNDAGTVRLRNQSGGVFLEVNYSDDAPWPTAADGTGHSLVLSHPSYGEDNPRAWAPSDSIGGSPGRLDAFTPDPLRTVVINEWLAHTDLPEVDYIELHNRGPQPVDLSGCVLSDDAEVDKFLIPPGTSIPANGFVWFGETTLGFALSADGETLYFKNASKTRVLDTVRFRGQENGVAMGRVPDGAPEFHRLTDKTPGTSNPSALISDVVINELMYHPISEDDDDQYVELYNRGTGTVNLGGWTLGGGIDFSFPEDTLIGPGDHLVVAKDAARLLMKYPALNAAATLGNFGGKLSGRGERLTLRKPDSIVDTNGSVVFTNFFQIPVDEVRYGTGGRWPSKADGGGSSLELIDPRSNHRRPSNWADSDETQKAPWTVISATGTIDNGNVAADQLQVLLMGEGECLIDDVAVLTPQGQNLIDNPDFESDATGWTAEGTESQSGWETGEGHDSSRSYRVRAVKRGDNQINRVRTPLTSSLPPGTTNVTIRAAVRWLTGHPQILLRLRGNWLECAGDMAPPVAAGTPGAPNSRGMNNAPPAITDTIHSPVLPAADEPIRITARVEDPDGISSVSLRYRIDPGATVFVLPMTDDGTGADAAAGDGVFTATVPGQSAGTTLAFHVRATDGAGPAATGDFPDDAPQRECLVRVGEVQPTGNFPVYRLWMTAATLNTWAGRHRLDNSPFDVTFVLGNDRVIYNAQALYAGSPYIAPGFSSPTAGRCGYSIELPKDDLFLGDTDLVLDWPGGHGNESTALQERMAYWIADKLDLPFSHRYPIRLHVHGVTDDARQAVFEAVLQPGSTYVDQWMPDDTGGQFFKIERAFEFSDAGGLIADPQPRLQDYTTTGGAKKRETYRWFFPYRATARAHDYTGVFALADALNAPGPEPYTSTTSGLADVEEWMRVFAAEHIFVNFDSYGHDIGKNMYAYKPPNGKWQLYMFDLDWLMLVSQYSGGRPPDSAPLFSSEDPTIARMYAHPPFLRAYWRAVEDALRVPFDPTQYGPVMDAKYESLRANGIRWCDGGPLTDPSAVKTWFATRRTFLQNQLAGVDSSFDVNDSAPVADGVATLGGTAPVGVVTITVNGVPWRVRWTGVTAWEATVPLQPGGNLFDVAGLDSDGQPIPGATDSVSVSYGGTTPSPVGSVVINEIMANPTLPDAEYIELANTSIDHTFDLSEWEVNGLGYRFPGGSFIAPASYLVLAKDYTPFLTAYGPDVQVFDDFTGNLQSNGETLSLLKPGPATNGFEVVDRVRYEAVAPWPVTTNGASLELRDAARDNSRVANWAAGGDSGTPAPSLALIDYPDPWKYMQVANLDGQNWTSPAFSDASWPSGPGLLAYESNPAIVPLIQTVLNDPRDNINGLSSGHAYYFRKTISIPTDLAGYTLQASAYLDDGAVFYVNGNEVKRVRMPDGEVTHLTFTTGQPPGGDAINPDVFTLPGSFFVPGPNVLAVEVHQNIPGSSDITFGLKLDAEFTGLTHPIAPATPGEANTVADLLPAFPEVWLNEAQPDNLTGPTDNYGQREPWVELWNSGAAPLNLDGCFLSNNYTNLAQWSFPSGTVIPAGGFLVVWCDKQTNQTAGGALHTNFELASGSGRIALSRSLGGTQQLVDYLTYDALPSNWSYGDVPDGQPFYRDNMFFTTPGGTNDGRSPPITVFINEWMADNTSSLADPADGSFEDWFELYNPGPAVVDVGGYYLTDDLSDPTQFLIPANGHYLVPPNGFLLVWADNEADQNSTNRADLHVNFALSKGGEAIGLFGADGTQMDAVTFGAQTQDVTEGRFPDGTGALFEMPTPTPRAANVLPNSPPTLAPIQDQEATVGQLIAFTAEAGDTDLPPQTLTFSLDGAVPPGAEIAPNTGRFTWSPVSAPATNSISIVVADSGIPSLTATQTFLVTVFLPPDISVRVNDGGMQISWPRGMLQEADDVHGPYSDVTSISPLTVDLSESRRFYRIRL